MRPGEWVAEKIVAAINAAAVTGSGYVPGNALPISAGTAVAIRRLPRFTLEDLAELKTCVASRSRAMTGGGRNPRRHEVTCQIMLLQKLDVDHTGLEDLLELVYAIDMLIAKQPDLGWISSNNDPEYDTDALETQCVFKSVLTMTFASIT